jgi:hypothetical protein
MDELDNWEDGEETEPFNNLNNIIDESYDDEDFKG